MILRPGAPGAPGALAFAADGPGARAVWAWVPRPSVSWTGGTTERRGWRWATANTATVAVQPVCGDPKALAGLKAPYSVLVLLRHPLASQASVINLARLSSAGDGVRYDAVRTTADQYHGQWTLNGVLNLSYDIDGTTNVFSDVGVLTLLSVGASGATAYHQFADGSSDTRSTASSALAISDPTMYVGTNTPGSDVAQPALVAVLRGTTTALEFASLARDPWQVFERRKGARLVVLGAGGAQSGEVTESTSAGDAVSAVLIRAGGVSEDASAADSQSATGGLVAAVADAAAAGDTVEAALVIAVGVAESAGPTDAAAAALALALAIVDAATAGDSSAATAALAAAVDEAQSAADGVSAGLQAAAAVSESQTAGDAQTAVAVLVAALTEASTPVDTQSTGPVVTGDVAESASATDTITAIAALAAEQAESTAAADAITAVAQMVAQIAEATTAADAVTAGLTMLALLTEAATPADTVTGTVGAVTHNVSIEEVATALDTLVAFMLSRNSAPPVSQRLQGALRAVSLQTARRVNVQKSRR